MSSALCGDGSPLLVWREQPADGEGRCQVPCDGWRARSLQTQWGENIIKKIKQTNKHCQTINNKQVMVGEHDHCKHNEVKTSWEKKNKTNKQRKQKTKKATTKWWLGRTTTASTTRWEMHRTTSTTSKNKQQQKFTSTSWLQAQRGDKLYDASTEIMIITNKLFETITLSNNNNKWHTTSKSSNNKRPQQKSKLSNNKQQSGRRQELRARLCSAQAP